MPQAIKEKLISESFQRLLLRTESQEIGSGAATVNLNVQNVAGSQSYETAINISQDRIGINKTDPTVALDVAGNVKVSGDLNVSTNANFLQNAVITNDLTVGGDIILQGDTVLQTSMTVSSLTQGRVLYSAADGEIVDNQYFRFDGTTLELGPDVNPKITLNQSTGHINMLGGNITTTGNVQAADISVTDDLTVGDELTVSGTATIEALVVNTLTHNGDLSLTGDFSVSGDTTLQALNAQGNVTLGGTLGVTGATTLSGNVTIQDADFIFKKGNSTKFSINDDGDITNLRNILTTTGYAYFGGEVKANSLDINSNNFVISSNGDAHGGGDLLIDGTATFGNIDINTTFNSDASTNDFNAGTVNIKGTGLRLENSANLTIAANTANALEVAGDVNIGGGGFKIQRAIGNLEGILGYYDNGSFKQSIVFDSNSNKTSIDGDDIVYLLADNNININAPIVYLSHNTSNTGYGLVVANSHLYAHTGALQLEGLKVEDNIIFPATNTSITFKDFTNNQRLLIGDNVDVEGLRFTGNTIYPISNNLSLYGDATTPSLEINGLGKARFYENVSIGGDSFSRKLDVVDNSGNSQLRLEYDGTHYAEFRAGSTLNGDLDINPSSTNSHNITLSRENPASGPPTYGATIKIDGYASQISGWSIDYLGSADFRYLYTDELHAKSFIADIEQALAGMQIIAKSVAILAEDFTVPDYSSSSTNLKVRELPGASGMRVFVDGDWVRLRAFNRGTTNYTNSTEYSAIMLDMNFGLADYTSDTEDSNLNGHFQFGTEQERGKSNDLWEEDGSALINGHDVGVIAVYYKDGSGADNSSDIQNLKQGSIIKMNVTGSNYNSEVRAYDWYYLLLRDPYLASNAYSQNTPGSNKVWIFDVNRLIGLSNNTEESWYVAGSTNSEVAINWGDGTSSELLIGDAWGTVEYEDNPSEGVQRYSFFRGTSAGFAGGVIPPGEIIEKDSIALDYGTVGQGYYEVNAIDGYNSANSPYAQTVSWDDGANGVAGPGTPGALNINSRFGNLKGITGQVEYGFFGGEGTADTDSHLILSNLSAKFNNIPIEMYDASVLRMKISPTLADGTKTPYIGTGTYTNGIRGSSGGSGFLLIDDGSNSSFYMGNQGGTEITYDGSTGVMNITGAIDVSQATGWGDGDAPPTDAEPNPDSYSFTPSNLDSITPNATGLWLGSNIFGHYDSTNQVWISKFTNTGGMYLANSSGQNKFEWNGSTLTIRGELLLDDGTPVTQGMNWLGNWSNTTEYAVNDAVSYQGSSYICQVAHNSQQNSGNSANPSTNNGTGEEWGILSDANTGVNGTDADIYNYIYKDSATAPATPDASAGVPNGWSDNVIASGSLSDDLWMSLGKQTQGVGNFVWDAPVKISGTDGASGSSGSDGVDAIGVSLTSNNMAITYDQEGADPDPQTYMLTAFVVNSPTTTYYEFFKQDSNGVYQSIDSDTPTITPTRAITPDASYSNMPEAFQVQVRSGSATGDIVGYDVISVIGVQQGVNTLNAILSNETHVIVKDGNTYTFDESATSVLVLEGNTELVYDTNLSSNSTYKVVANYNDCASTGSPTTDGNKRVYPDLTGVTYPSTNGISRVFTITVKNQYGDESTIVKTQTFGVSVSGQGAQGPSGDDGTDGQDGGYLFSYLTTIAHDDAEDTMGAGNYWSGNPTATSGGSGTSGGSMIGGEESSWANHDGFQIFHSDNTSTSYTNALNQLVKNSIIKIVQDENNWGKFLVSEHLGYYAINGYPVYKYSTQYISHAGTYSTGTMNHSIHVFTAASPGVDGAVGADGAEGVDGVGISLTADNQVFTYDQEGANPSPQSATITANVYGTVTSSQLHYKFFKNDVADSTSQSTSTSATYTYTVNTDGDNMPDKIEVEVRYGTDDTGPIIARDLISMSALLPGTDGAAGVQVILSNETHTCGVDPSNGEVLYTGSGTDLYAFIGTTPLPYYNTTGTSANTFSVSAVGTDIDPHPVPVSDPSTSPANLRRIYGDADNMDDDTAFITFTITITKSDLSTEVITKKQTFSQSTSGADGTSGSVWHTGADEPSVNLGVNGDFYLRTTDESVWLKSNGSWSTIINTLAGTDGQDGDDGAQGNWGPAGTSIVWKGSYEDRAAFISANSPVLDGYAYYDEELNGSYTYSSSSYHQMTADGVDGQAGQNGLPIVWKGDDTSAPSNPVENWAYRNTTTNIIYIYDGSSWDPMVYDGNDGTDGTQLSWGLGYGSSTATFNGFSIENDSGSQQLDFSALSSTANYSVIIAKNDENGSDRSSVIQAIGSGNIIRWQKDGSSEYIEVQLGTDANGWQAEGVYDLKWGTATIKGHSQGTITSEDAGEFSMFQASQVYITYNANDPNTTPSTPDNIDGTSPSGWYTAPDAAANWMSQKVDNGSTSNWGAPIRIGGINADVQNWIFQTNSTAPSTPADSPGVPNGWQDDAPASVPSGELLYACLGTQSNGTGDFVWGTVIQLSGADGYEGSDADTYRTVYAYKDANPSNPPSAPQNTDGSIGSDGDYTAPQGWSENIFVPNNSDNRLYITQATFKQTDPTQSFTMHETWGTPVQFTGVDGTNGTDGLRGSESFSLGRTDETETWHNGDAYSLVTTNSSDGTIRQFDTVTFFNQNATTPWSMTKYYVSGTGASSSWTDSTLVVDGDTIIHGTVGADQIAANSITATEINSGLVWSQALAVGNNFTVNATGDLTASNADVTGSITATDGSFENLHHKGIKMEFISSSTDPQRGNIILGNDITGKMMTSFAENPVTTGSYDNLIMGDYTFAQNEYGSGNIVFGTKSMQWAATTSISASRRYNSRNIVIGNNSGNSVTTGADNIIIGSSLETYNWKNKELSENFLGPRFAAHPYQINSIGTNHHLNGKSFPSDIWGLVHANDSVGVSDSVGALHSNFETEAGIFSNFSCLHMEEYGNDIGLSNSGSYGLWKDDSQSSNWNNGTFQSIPDNDTRLVWNLPFLFDDPDNTASIDDMCIVFDSVRIWKALADNYSDEGYTVTGEANIPGYLNYEKFKRSRIVKSSDSSYGLTFDDGTDESNAVGNGSQILTFSCLVAAGNEVNDDGLIIKLGYAPATETGSLGSDDNEFQELRSFSQGSIRKFPKFTNKGKFYAIEVSVNLIELFGLNETQINNGDTHPLGSGTANFDPIGTNSSYEVESWSLQARLYYGGCLKSGGLSTYTIENDTGGSFSTSQHQTTTGLSTGEYGLTFANVYFGLGYPIKSDYTPPYSGQEVLDGWYKTASPNNGGMPVPWYKGYASPSERDQKDLSLGINDGHFNTIIGSGGDLSTSDADTGATTHYMHQMPNNVNFTQYKHTKTWGSLHLLGWREKSQQVIGMTEEYEPFSVIQYSGIHGFGAGTGGKTYISTDVIIGEPGNSSKKQFNFNAGQSAEDVSDSDKYDLTASNITAGANLQGQHLSVATASITTLPTSDPGVPGKLWVDTNNDNVLKVSSS